MSEIVDKELLSSISSLPKESKYKLKTILPDIMSKVVSENLLNSLEDLTEEEYSIFVKMMIEASEGSLFTYEEYTYEDYEEIPVSIEEFVCSPEYLGRSTEYGDLIYPYWKDAMSNVMSKDSTTVEFVLAGAIGIGKSTIALICISYCLYKLLCLRNPAKYYKLLEGSKIAIAIFNITLNQVYGIAYDKLQSMLKRSPWFLRHGTLSGRQAKRVSAMVVSGEEIPLPLLENLTYSPGKDIHIVVGSQESSFTGYDVFCGFIDEMNFYKKGGKAPDPAKFMQSGIMKVYSAIKRRMESRFMLMGKVPGLLILVSSKRAESDPLEQYVKRVANSNSVYVVDEPQWVVKNLPGKYSGTMFRLLVGDKYRETRILADTEDSTQYESEGRTILDVPIEHYDAFKIDPDQALTDIAGISLVSGRKFINANNYLAIISKYKKNLFKQDIVEMGMKSGGRLEQFFDLSQYPQSKRSRHHFIHWDASKTGDRTGISLVAITETSMPIDRLVDGEVIEVMDRIYDHVASVAVQASQGDEIPFRRLFEFILWLRVNGVHITSLTMDSYQSVSVLQDSNDAGIPAKTLSVDRSPDPYYNLRTCINEKRLDTFKSELMESELTELEQNSLTDKIDHTASGCLVGSTLVQTTKGPVRIKDLVSTDTLYSYDLETKSLIESSFRDLRVTKETTELYEIELVSGQLVQCTSNHPILTTKGYKRADELTEYDEVITCSNPKVEVELYRGSSNKLSSMDDIIYELYVINKMSTREVNRSIGLGRTTLLEYLRRQGYLRTKSESSSLSVSKYPNKVLTTSYLERELFRYLDAEGTKVISQYEISNYFVDIYIPRYKLVIEVNGSRYHDDPDYEHEKALFIISKGYDYIVISDYLCQVHGHHVYNTLLIDYPRYSGEVYYNEYLSNCRDFSRYLSKEDRSTYRYGIKSYKGFKLSDHWKYKYVSESEFKSFIGTSRLKSLSDLYEMFGTRNKIRRIVREYYDIDFTEFQARYLRYTRHSSWSITKLIILYLESGEIPPSEGDPLTLESYRLMPKGLTDYEKCKYLAVSRNYLLRWELELKDYLEVRGDTDE